MISKEDIITVLSPLNFWGNEQQIGSHREKLVQTLKNLINVKNKTIAVIGVRRCGKTTLIKQTLSNKIQEGLKKEQTLYINFEDPKLDPFLSLELLDEIYTAYKTIVNKEEKECLIVLDEVQNIDKWEKWVRIMQEKKEKTTIIVTGSSSKLLAAEFSTVLTGRTLKLKIFPLSFSEFISFKGLEIKSEMDKIVNAEKIQKHLNEYLFYGGFPEVFFENEDNKYLILKEYFEDIVTRDVIKRFSIRDSYQAKVTAELAINNFSS